jgi:hypothetical protein
MRKHAFLSFTIGSLVLGAACSTKLENPSFDLNCAGSVCAWEIDEGKVQKVPTWHERDEALEFVSTPAQISQYVAGDLTCPLRVEVMGEIDASAKLTVSVDLNDDGETDAEYTLREDLDWDSHTFYLNALDDAEDFRFVIRKDGPGRAILAHVFAEEDCER